MSAAESEALRLFIDVEILPTDMDGKFLDDFIDLYIHQDEGGLKLVEQFYRKSQRSEVLLAIYIHLLRKIVMRGESSFLENPNVRNFLVNNETTLFNGSATLRQAAFQLVSDMELLRIKCPFVFDVDEKICQVLTSDATSLFVRTSVEHLSCVRLRSSSASVDYLYRNLAESLLNTDYMVILDSISRVLLEFVKLLDDDLRARLLSKAKSVRRMGLQFARLTAKILVHTKRIKVADFASGFTDNYTHALIVSELLKFNRDSLNFDEHDLLDLLIQIAADRPNFIVPNLERITFANNEDARIFLKPIVPLLSNVKHFNDKNVLSFLQFLGTVDDELQLFPDAISVLERRILNSPSLTKAIHSLSSPSFEQLLEQTRLRAIFSAAVTRMMVKYETEADESEEWEENDSTLEILSVCGVHRLECDFVRVVKCLFTIIETETSDFVRSSARNCLTQIASGDDSTNAEWLSDEMRDKLKLLVAEEEMETQQRTEAKTELMNTFSRRSNIEDIIVTLRNTSVDDCIAKECY